MLPSLYIIQQDHLNLINLIEENGGEVNEEILDQLALTEEQFEQKAVSYANVVKVFENDEKIIDEEIERLQELKKRKAKAKDAFKTKLGEAMQQFGFDKIETPTRKLSFRKSESVLILDEEEIPVSCCDVIPQQIVPVKDLIKKELKAGKVVPGAQLVTKMNLQIK